MAIRRKDEKKVKAVPAALSALVETASTYSVAAAFFKDRYEAARQKVCDYLDAKDCPVEAGVGAGNGVKIDGIASLSFTQPSRVDNAEAVDAIVAALKSGALKPDALVEVISTVSREGLEKCLPDVAKGLVKTSEGIVTTIRVANEYKTEIACALGEAVDSVGKKSAVIEIPVAQPDTFAAAVAREVAPEKVGVPA